MVLLAVIAFFDLRARDSSRMVMTFYTAADGKSLVEERLMKNTESRAIEMKVTGYVDEVLLGPLSPGAAGFFPVATVQSCVVSDGTAYIGLPSSVGLAGTRNADDHLTVDTARSFDTLKKDIGRNFRDLKDIVLFIEGREVVP
jgi:hypothetical protein